MGARTVVLAGRIRGVDSSLAAPHAVGGVLPGDHHVELDEAGRDGRRTGRIVGQRFVPGPRAVWSRGIRLEADVAPAGRGSVFA